MNALSRLFRFESRTKAALHIDPKKDGFEPSWFELLLELKNFSWAQLGKYQLKLIIIFSVKIQEFSQCTMEPNNNKSFFHGIIKSFIERLELFSVLTSVIILIL